MNVINIKTMAGRDLYKNTKLTLSIDAAAFIYTCFCKQIRNNYWVPGVMAPHN